MKIKGKGFRGSGFYTLRSCQASLLKGHLISNMKSTTKCIFQDQEKQRGLMVNLADMFEEHRKDQGRSLVKSQRVLNTVSRVQTEFPV